MNKVCTKNNSWTDKVQYKDNNSLIVLTFKQTVLFFFISNYEVSSQTLRHSIF